MINEEQRLIIEALDDPTVVEREMSRRQAFGNLGGWGAGLVLASVPAFLAVWTSKAFAQVGMDDRIINALNMLLTAERLEVLFYTSGLNTPGLIPAQDRPIFEQILRNEQAHLAFLEGVLGANAARRADYDLTAGGQFDPLNDYDQFLALSQGFEETGQRGIKGQAGNVAHNKVVLSAALRAHSVEARHVSEVRRLRGERAGTPEQAPFKGWPTRDLVDIPALQPIYEGEDNVVHAGVDLRTLDFSGEIEPAGFDIDALTEAFDEPLTARQVVTILSQFGTGRPPTS